VVSEVVEFSFTISFPGADRQYVRLVLDALRNAEDSVVSVKDGEDSIRVSVRPVYSMDVSSKDFADRVSSYADMLKKTVERAIADSEKRYRLYCDLKRIDRVINTSEGVQEVAKILPSIW